MRGTRAAAREDRRMKTYRVVTAQDTVFWGGALEAQTFEDTLNRESAEGWDLVTTTTVESETFLGEQHQLFFVFAQASSPKPA